MSDIIPQPTRQLTKTEIEIQKLHEKLISLVSYSWDLAAKIMTGEHAPIKRQRFDLIKEILKHTPKLGQDNNHGQVVHLHMSVPRPKVEDMRQTQVIDMSPADPEKKAE